VSMSRFAQAIIMCGQASIEGRGRQASGVWSPCRRGTGHRRYRWANRQRTAR